LLFSSNFVLGYCVSPSRSAETLFNNKFKPSTAQLKFVDFLNAKNILVYRRERHEEKGGYMTDPKAIERVKCRVLT
jgi:hypothetical protein